MNFIKLEQISERPFSSIYKIRSENDGKIFAYKEIKRNLLDDNEIRRFKRSFISISKISHVNCVKMIEYIDMPDSLGYIMEYVDGFDLSSLECIKTGKDFHKLIPIILQICHGLNALHQKKIIHRDLKPSNILITKENIVKITDFDFIKLKDQLDITNEGIFLGTVKYASPEQCVDASTIGLKSDLYSLGVIIYELITGETPFNGRNYGEIVLKHLKEPVISPRKIKPDLTWQAEELVLRLLEKNPEQRFTSTGQLVAYLSKIPFNRNFIVDIKKIKSDSLPSVFVGREYELTSIKKIFLKKNFLRLACIRGEAGIGKTKLWNQFKISLQIEQVPVIDIRCRENGPVYEPLKKLIMEIIERFRDFSTFEMFDLLDEFSRDLIEIIPELEKHEFFRNLEKLPKLTKQEQEIRIFETITSLLRNFSNKINTGKQSDFKGIVIFFDDFHWADQSFQKWFIYATRNLCNSNLFLLFSYNPDFDNKGKIFEFTNGDLPIDTINLKPFSLLQIKKLFLSIFSAEPSDEIIQLINNITGGNPLYIRELLNHLNMNKKIKSKDDVLIIDKNEISDYQTYSFNTIIGNKIRQLNPDIQKILKLAAIIGENFNFTLLRAVSNFSEDHLLSILDEARSVNLVNYSRQVNFYKFHHSLIRKFLMSQLKGKEKLEYHTIVAENIEKKINDKCLRFEKDEIIENLAEHYFKAEKTLRSFKYCAKAAFNSANKYSNDKAIYYYQMVIDILRRNKKYFLELNYLIEQGKIYQHIGKWEKAEGNFIESMNIATKLNQKKKITVVNNYLGTLYVLRTQFKKAQSCFDNELNISKDLKDDYCISRSYFNLAKLNYCRKNYSNALLFFDKSAKLAGKINDRVMLAKINLNIGSTYFGQGNFTKALVHYKKSLEFHQKLNNLLDYSTILGNIGGVYWAQSNFKEALKYNSQKLNISKNIGHKFGVARAYGSLGNIYLAQDKLVEAIGYFQKELSIYQELDCKDDIANNLGNLGIIYRKMKDYDQSWNCYQQNLKIQQGLNNERGIALVYLNMGVLSEKQGQFNIALDYFFKSFNLSSKLEILTTQANALMSIGLIYAYDQDFENALDYFKKAQLISEKYNYYSKQLDILFYISQICSYKKEYSVVEECYRRIEKIEKHINNPEDFKFINLNKVEFYVDINEIDKAEKILEKGNFHLNQFIVISKILSRRIELIRTGNKKLLTDLERRIDQPLKIEEQAYLYYSLWKYHSMDRQFDLEKAKLYCSSAYRLYDKLFKEDVNIDYKIKLFELADYLKNKYQVVEMKKSNTMELISSLVRFLNSKTAFRELLNYLTINTDADNALLLIRKDTELIKNNDELSLFGFDKFYIKVYSANLSKDQINFSKNILNKVIIKQESILIPNALEQSDLKNNPSIVGKLFLSVLSIPLIDKQNNLIGALYLDRTDIKKEPFNDNQLFIAEEIANILTPLLIEHEVQEYQKISAEIEKLDLFVGISQEMKDLYKKIERAASVDMSVLIQGETGTGKELVARAIHKLSERRNNPFIAINCSAIPKDLAESELFGHEKGSFSGAVATQKGKFEIAEGGIIFLDEIADLHPELQAKLLRVLENRKIWRIGGQQELPVDVRIISSSHKNIAALVKENLFREDLFQRLNILDINVVPLRERKEDIPLLSYHFLKKLCQKYNCSISGFTNDALINLQSYHWPGNVRELENFISKAFVNHEGNNPINCGELFPDKRISETEFVVDGELKKNQSLDQFIEGIEKKLVLKILEKNNWNISLSAKDLNINRMKLYRLIKKYNFRNTK